LAVGRDASIPDMASEVKERSFIVFRRFVIMIIYGERFFQQQS
jgi:hypothetical protein